MNRSHRGIKRKQKNGADDKTKKDRVKKEEKHLLEFGEKHPLGDKLDNLEDKLAKRVYDDDTDNVKNEEVDYTPVTEDIGEHFYEKLLDAFGKKQGNSAESDEESEDEMLNNDAKLNKKGNEVEDQEDFADVDDGNDEIDDIELETNNDEDVSKQSDTVDNFSQHFFTNFDSKDIKLLKDGHKPATTSYDWPGIGSFVEVRPDCDKFNLVQIKKPFTNVNELQLRQLLKENFPKTMLNITDNRLNCLTAYQTELLGLLSTYKNVYSPERTFDNAEENIVVYCAHTLNHILKTRSRIISHNSKISQHKVSKEEYRDQGLTRPKVLIVVPFRDSVYRIVNCMINLLFGDAKDSGDRKPIIMNYKRLKKEFGPDEDEAPIGYRKPEDYKKLFNGNIDDSFRVGLSITKKSLKLYSEFYSSDIIIASPMGLRLIIGAEGEDEREYDFLSSLDIVIFDQMEVFLMQNWEHLLHLMKHIHLQPKENRDIDFSRIKLWVLELWSRFYYQLIVFSSVSSTMISGFFNKYSTNFAGKLIVRNEVVRNRAAINHVYLQCPQIYHRFNCDSFVSNSDTRFQFFINKILPKFRDKLMVRTMIYVPSYFDFVRLRNYFRKEDIGFSQICEYTNEGKVAKARHIFFYGGRHFLLFTERFHFFNRFTIKGIRHLIFYEPPTYPHFYSEIVNSMHLSNQGKKLATDYSSMSVTVLFNRYDAHSLVSLVGTKTTASLLQSTSDVHMFITENALS